MAILLGSGIKGKNVRQLSETIIKKFEKMYAATDNDMEKTLSEVSIWGNPVAIISHDEKKKYVAKKYLEAVGKNEDEIVWRTFWKSGWAAKVSITELNVFKLENL